MEKLFIPNCINMHLQNMEFVQNNIGCSSADVYKFFSPKETFYLKIEPKCGELQKEYRNMLWLQRKAPVPKIIEWHSDDEYDYLLTQSLKGEMACSDYYLSNPVLAVSVLAEGINFLRSININNCPIRNDLNIKLADAKSNIQSGNVNIDDWEAENANFPNPQAMYEYLCKNKPENEELVFSHGDYCLPNIFGEKGSLSGFIDLGRAGVADLWQDVALCIRSFRSNFNTKEYDSLLLEKLGIPLNQEKLDYYILLDELF